MADDKATATQKDILSSIMTDGGLVRNPSDQEYANSLVATYVKEVLAQDKADAVPSDAVAFINQKISEIDQALSAQLDEILHHDKFRALEGSWRGLNYLVMNTETLTHLKIRVLNISKEELAKDLEKAVEFDQSNLFKKVYEQEYGTFGGSPYSCLLADYEFTATPADMEIVKDLSGVGAAAFAPIITAAAPSMFNLGSYQELGKPRDLAKIFDSLDKINEIHSVKLKIHDMLL